MYSTFFSILFLFSGEEEEEVIEQITTYFFKVFLYKFIKY
jgi:uncharacterized protein YlzI (FlbEa/FlbD family)